MRGSTDYAASGVNLDAADSAKRRIREHVESTFTEGVVGGFGGFGGMFRMPPASSDQILVASTDGVGTKVRVAIAADRHDSVGQCLVNHCVNDILVQGATPLFFLDYLAFGRLEPVTVERLVAGVARACRENGAALIGGETAEMPGVYTPPDYDMAGTIVGIADPTNIPGASRVREGDALVALASSGLHTNGYSLARRIVFEILGLAVGDPFPGEDAAVADVLLRVHRSYLHLVRPVLGKVHALAHITGSGITGNLNRALPEGVDAIVQRASWEVPSVFRVLQEGGRVSDEEMFRTFNMGVGMVAVMAPENTDELLLAARSGGVEAWIVGEVKPGSGKVQLV